MIKERIKLKLRFRTNVRSHLRWFSFLFSPAFYTDIRRRFETVSTVAHLRQVVSDVIDQEIYSIASNSPRTGDLGRSITAVAGDNEGQAGATVYFDPSIAAAKGPINGGDAGALNYAAFFDRPEFNSFILGSGLDVFNPIKYRPFSEPMTLAFDQEAKVRSIKAILQSMKSMKPKERKVN